MSSHRRGPWSQGEDAYLVQLVHTQGALNWVRIAQLIGSRSPKQCRERYHQNLKPSLNHEPISPEEGLQIERMVSEMGKRWAEIARRLHGRSDNAVKNWWNGSMNRRRRLVMRRRTSTQHHPSSFDERSQPLSFARPAANRPVNISSAEYARHSHDMSLPSPSVSEASRAESVDGAPSLVSDDSSRFSISPRLAKSPSIELPPLAHNAFRDSRRPSLPAIPFRANYNNPESETTYSAPRYETPKSYGTKNLQTPMYYRHELQPHSYQVHPQQQQQQHLQALPTQSPRDAGFYSESRAQLLTAPSTPVQLPPLHFGPRHEPTSAGPRDTRMHLSSLLG